MQDIDADTIPLEEVFSGEPFTGESLTMHFEGMHYLYGDYSHGMPENAVIAEILGQPASGKHSICTLAQSGFCLSPMSPSPAIFEVEGIPTKTTYERDFWVNCRRQLIEEGVFDPLNDVSQLKRELSLAQTLDAYKRFCEQSEGRIPAIITPNFTIQVFVANLLGVESIRNRLIQALASRELGLVELSLDSTLEDLALRFAKPSGQDLTGELWDIVADGCNPFLTKSGSIGVWYQSPTPFIFFTNSRREESVARARDQKRNGSPYRTSSRDVLEISESVWIAQNIIHALILNRFGERNLKEAAFAYLLKDDKTFPFSQARQVCDLLHSKHLNRFR